MTARYPSFIRLRMQDSKLAPHMAAHRAWQDYAASVTICAAVTLLVAPLYSLLDLTNIAMFFLLAIVIVAMRYGRGPAVLAAVVGIGAFDFVYVPPRFRFAISDTQYLLSLFVTLVVVLVISKTTARLKIQAHLAQRGEERFRALYEMSRDLSGAVTTEQVTQITASYFWSKLGLRAAIIATDAQGGVTIPSKLPGLSSSIEVDLAQWALDHATAAGRGAEMHPDAPLLYLPLKAPTRVRGILIVETDRPRQASSPDPRQLLDTCASVLAISLERIHYAQMAQVSALQIESERLRNALLAAISHDLRTPLAVLAGMAETLVMIEDPPPSPLQREISAAMSKTALHMNALFNNLLDMARIQTGQVQLNRQWLPVEEVIGSAINAMNSALDPQCVQVVLPDELPLLFVDAALIERVFCNLLDNAQKYSPVGSQILIGAFSSSECVTITVDDFGPGLPKGREEAIFMKFERGTKESTTPGVGMGLAICRAIMQALGGTIRGETRPAGGARFSIEFPLAAQPSIDEAEGEQPFQEHVNE